ncbi:unnamed protein product [Linum tenue]|uniref:F-box domain-containing protein n=1 Tax=Linum tenue TaxID=586396 RepID=A0AAV0QAX8_9ROSI|nr:unnamed protein product [Linum tenue]
MVLLSSSEATSAQLPEHMVEAVLVKLPVRTLLRLKLLSRSFKALIENPRFVTAHINSSSHVHRPIALLTGNYSTDDTILIGKMLTLSRQHDVQDWIHRKEEQLPTFASDEDDDEGDMFHYVELLGSHNGLICLRLHYDHHRKNKLVLWNPATKQYRTLPPPPSASPSLDYSSKFRRVVELGFAYNHATNDYMVSQIASLVDDDWPHHLSYQLEIFSMKRWGWRTHTYRRELASNIPKGSMSSQGLHNPVALRGSIYQVVSLRVARAEACCWFVLAVDFTDTLSSNDIVFRRIELPPLHEDGWVSSLVVYGEGDDQLGLFSNIDGEEDELPCFKCNVWVLSNDSVWTKSFTISIVYPASVVEPVASWCDGKIIVRRTTERKEEEEEEEDGEIGSHATGNTLFIYDHHSITKGGDPMSDELVGISDFISDVCAYVESLVSLHPS